MEKEKKKSSGFDKTITIILVLIIAAMAGVAIYQMLAPAEDLQRLTATETEVTTVNVSATAAERKQFIATTRFQGEVVSDEANISVLPETAGTLNSLQVKRGDHVETGDVVAYVDPSRPGAEYALSPVTAKASGEVVSIDSTIGSQVASTSSIVTIMPEKTIYVTTMIPERYIATLSQGLRGSVSSVAYTGESYPVEISYIAPMINNTNRTLSVDLSFTGDKGRLMEGMYVSIDLVTEQIDNALVIPSSAVTSYGGEQVVYVVENNQAVRKPVVTGSSNANETVILEGLNDGEIVITAGAVSDGTPVAIV